MRNSRFSEFLMAIKPFLRSLGNAGFVPESLGSFAHSGLAPERIFGA